MADETIEQVCPACGCSMGTEVYEKEGVKYCCEPCVDDNSECDCGCCHEVEEGK